MKLFIRISNIFFFFLLLLHLYYVFVYVCTISIYICTYLYIYNGGKSEVLLILHVGWEIYSVPALLLVVSDLFYFHTIRLIIWLCWFFLKFSKFILRLAKTIRDFFLDWSSACSLAESSNVYSGRIPIVFENDSTYGSMDEHARTQTTFHISTIFS